MAIAVMVWFIITTVAGLSYTNRGRGGKQLELKPTSTNAPTLANPELNGENDEPDDEQNK